MQSTTDKFFPEFQAIQKVTPALIKNTGFTNYTELIAFIEGLQRNFPTKVRITYIGNSKNGKPIPMITIENPEVKNPINLWMQGGLHGDEPAGTESILLFMHDLLYDDHCIPLLNRCRFAFIPMANIDGYLKQKRNNAEGLDLNRDQTKLLAAESINLKEAFSKFNPLIALDFHEYRPFRKDFVQLSTQGVSSAYDVMFLYSGNLNVPLNIRKLTQEGFVHATSDILSKHGYRCRDYITSESVKGDIHFNQGSVNPRSSATNFALQQCISTLVEVRGVGIGRTSFYRRVHIGKTIAQSYAEIAANLNASMLDSIKNAFNPEWVTVSSKRKVYSEEIPFIDLEKNELIYIPVTVKDAWNSTATLQRTRPSHYVLDASLDYLISKIQSFGLKVDTLKNHVELELESYTVNAYKKSTEL
jgi:hypothetical protein